MKDRSKGRKGKKWQKAINNHNEPLISNKYIQINHVQRQKSTELFDNDKKIINKMLIANDARSAKEKKSHTHTQFKKMERVCE